MQGGHCTCLSKAVEVSGVCLHILTVVRKASEAFFVGPTHECKRMLDSTMHRGVVFSIARAPAAIHCHANYIPLLISPCINSGW